MNLVLVTIGFMTRATVINAHSIGMYLLNLAIGLVVAYLIYWCFERNTAVCKRWLKNKIINWRERQSHVETKAW